jgi:aryl-alcohol dehydrogenase
LIGVPADPQAVFSIGLFQPPLLGLTIRGIVEGDADPKTFIPICSICTVRESSPSTS